MCKDNQKNVKQHITITTKQLCINDANKQINKSIYFFSNDDEEQYILKSVYESIVNQFTKYRSRSNEWFFCDSECNVSHICNLFNLPYNKLIENYKPSGMTTNVFRKDIEARELRKEQYLLRNQLNSRNTTKAKNRRNIMNQLNQEISTLWTKDTIVKMDYHPIYNRFVVALKYAIFFYDITNDRWVNTILQHSKMSQIKDFQVIYFVFLCIAFAFCVFFFFFGVHFLLFAFFVFFDLFLFLSFLCF